MWVNVLYNPIFSVLRYFFICHGHYMVKTMQMVVESFSGRQVDMVLWRGAVAVPYTSCATHLCMLRPAPATFTLYKHCEEKNLNCVKWKIRKWTEPKNLRNSANFGTVIGEIRIYVWRDVRRQLQVRVSDIRNRLYTGHRDTVNWCIIVICKILCVQEVLS